MKLLVTLTAAACLGASAAASPLEPRADTVTCSPTLQGSTLKKHMRVSVARAQGQMRKAGVSSGTSGDPHRYENRDGINWGGTKCDTAGAILLEYPIYWDGRNAEWEKNVKTDKQKGGPTPIRVVFANVAGATQYCGVMTHSVVTAQNQGLQYFLQCV